MIHRSIGAAHSRLSDRERRPADTLWAARADSRLRCAPSYEWPFGGTLHGAARTLPGRPRGSSSSHPDGSSQFALDLPGSGRAPAPRAPPRLGRDNDPRDDWWRHGGGGRSAALSGSLYGPWGQAEPRRRRGARCRSFGDVFGPALFGLFVGPAPIASDGRPVSLIRGRRAAALKPLVSGYTAAAVGHFGRTLCCRQVEGRSGRDSAVVARRVRGGERGSRPHVAAGSRLYLRAARIVSHQRGGLRLRGLFSAEG